MAQFSKFGEIFDYNVRSHPSGISKGFYFITFAERELVDRRLNAGPHFIDGVEVNVKIASKLIPGKEEIICFFHLGQKLTSS